MASGYWHRFDKVAAKYATQDAFLIDGNEHLSYQNLSHRVQRLSRFLTQRGLLSSSKVLIQCESPISMTALILACDYVGAKIVIANFSHGIHGIDACLKEVKPNLIIHDTLKTSQQIADRAKKLSIATSILWQDTAESWGELESIEPEDNQGAESKGLSFVSDQGADGKIYCFDPKDDQIFENAMKVNEHFSITNKTRIMHTMRWTSRIGLFVFIHGFCLSGASATISTKLSYKEQLSELANTDFYIDSSTQFIDMIENNLLAEIDEKSLPKTMVCVCGSLSVNYQLEYYRQYHRRIFITFGLSNIGFVGVSQATDTVPSYGWFSHIISDQSLRVDPEDNPTIPDEWTPESRSVGKITFIASNGDEYNTYRYGRLNDDNSATIYGDQSNFIDSLGLCCSEFEIESLLMVNPHIKDCAVIGLPHPRYGMALAAIVIFESNALNKSGSALIPTLIGKVARYKLPRKIITLNSFRRTRFGDVDKPFYRTHYQDIFQIAKD